MLDIIKLWILENPFILVAFAVILFNWVSGIIRYLFDFDWKLSLHGLFKVIQKCLTLIILVMGYYVFTFLKFPEIELAYNLVFRLLIILVLVYHINSILVNTAAVFGFEDAPFIGELDIYFKTLMSKSFWPLKKEGSA